MKLAAHIAFRILLALLPIFGWQSCGRDSDDVEAEDVLLVMGDSVLTRQAVEARIPVGISSADSAALFRKLVEGWLGDMVLTDMAKSKLPDFEQIERQVAAYRNRLIVSAYLSMMRSNSDSQVSDEAIRKFYESHRGDMRVERPLVKGLLLKVPASVGGLNEIKRCVFTASSESLDELERRWATDAVQYDYFEHVWVDWQTISEQIPYRFYDPDAFVESTQNFETSAGGTVYLLHISEYLPTGSEMPYEFAYTRIKAILEKAKMSKYEQDLVESLVKRAISDDRLVVVGYDPLKGSLIKRGEDIEIKQHTDEK